MKLRKLIYFPLILVLASCNKGKTKGSDDSGSKTNSVTIEEVFTEKGTEVSNDTSKANITRGLIENIPDTLSAIGIDFESELDMKLNYQNMYYVDIDNLFTQASLDVKLDKSDATKNAASFNASINGDASMKMVTQQGSTTQNLKFDDIKASAYLANAKGYADLSDPKIQSLLATCGMPQQMYSAFCTKFMVDLSSVGSFEEICIDEIEDEFDDLIIDETMLQQVVSMLGFEETASGYRVSISYETILNTVTAMVTPAPSRAVEATLESTLISILQDFTGSFTVCLDKQYRLTNVLISLATKVPSEMLTISTKFGLKIRYGNDVKVTAPASLTDYTDYTQQFFK